jgi:hypothetical protein
MKYRHALFAAVLAAVASSASAHVADVIVAPEEACPAGTFPSIPAYNWKDGRFVLDGWVCESPHKRGN